MGNAVPRLKRLIREVYERSVWQALVVYQVIVYEGGEHLLPEIEFWPDVADWLDRKVPVIREVGSVN